MRINEDTLLEGKNVVLVPYNADHVPRYHQWMESSELQQLTASEPLTLEQEYDMQSSWREDDDSEHVYTHTHNHTHTPKKGNGGQPLLLSGLFVFRSYVSLHSSFHSSPECTFIILDKQRWADPAMQEEQCMVGDVNIFLTDPSDPSLAELEIMIAEPCYRGKGLGKEVTWMMICYGVTKLGIQKFEAKIGLDNKVSIAMFKKFHFHELSVSEVFKEVTLGLTVDKAMRTKLMGDMAFMKEQEYRKARESRQEGTLPNTSHASL
ncbi:N-acetyltransferase 9 isoform X1 [Osmerus mordax]|uniref:N-acetyltransferase 9 isoform X1 n=1 Tax=Osmerus mordax TaxID=8014 RepID=UPI0035109807